MNAIRAKALGTVLIGSLTVAAGCSAYHSGYYYAPKPADLFVAAAADETPGTAHLLVSVIGVRRADKKAGEPASVEVRMRVVNTGERPVSLEPGSLELVSGDLERFDTPRVEPAAGLSVAPGETGLVTALFDFPEGKRPRDVDLDTLSLNWTLRLGDEPVRGTTTFTQRYPYYHHGYYHRYPYGYYRHHFGYRWCD
ncbi:MAG: hypothetical protein V3U29_02815 [Phycisphaeraceae bacterium]